MKKEKCSINVGEGKKRVDCQEPPMVTLKVTVFHFNSGRTSKLTWHLCDPHAGEFFADGGKGWYAYYFKTGKDSPVIDFEVLIPVWMTTGKKKREGS